MQARKTFTRHTCIPAILLGLFLIWVSPAVGLAQVYDTLWLQDWNSGWGNWSHGIGVWELCYDGAERDSVLATKCGNYPDVIDSRVISPYFTVPNASEHPRLRFWQYFSYALEASDYGVVEIKPADSSSWREISRHYTTGTSGVWFRAYIDLTAYAGQTVQISFLHTVDNDGVGDGWSIDDVMIETSAGFTDPATTPQNWNEGWGDWYCDNGVWEICYDGAERDTVLATVCGSYPDVTDSRVISPYFIVPNALEHPRLRFWQYFNYALEASDYGVVEIRPADSSSWREISRHYTTGTSGGWFRAYVDLTAYAGQSVQISFLHSVDNNDAGDGWSIDEVRIETSPGFSDLATTPQDWDEGWGDWYCDNGVWELCYDGVERDSVVATGCGDYPGVTDSRVISPYFTVPDGSEYPRLRFRHYFDYAMEVSDYGVVQIKPADSSSWREISPHYTSGSSGEWIQDYLDLTPFAGQSVQLSFFHAADYDHNADGWRIDDVRIDRGNPPPLIVCPGTSIGRALCAPGAEVCVPLVVLYAESVVVENASWADDTLCFTADTEGTYVFSVTATNADGVDTCEVIVDVTQDVPLAISAGNLIFLTTDMAAEPPPAQTVQITSPCDPGSLNWTAAIEKGAGWLNISPASGTNPATVTVSIGQSTLPISAGVYSGLIAFHEDKASNSPVYVNVSLFVESGVNVGDYKTRTGTTFRIPVNLHTTASLVDFTLPLRLKTTQPDMVKLDSIIFDPTYIDSVVRFSAGEIVFLSIRPSPIPDDSAVTLGYAEFSVAAGAAPELFYFDTMTVIYDNVVYSYRFVTAAGDTVVPGFDKGMYLIGDSQSSPSLALTIGDVTCLQGRTVGVPVAVAWGLENVCGLQLQVHYDTSIVRVDSSIVTSDHFTPVVSTADGIIHLAGMTYPTNPVSVPDGGTLLTLWISGIGNPGVVCPLVWTGQNVLGRCDGRTIANVRYDDGGVTIARNRVLGGRIDYHTLTCPIRDVMVRLTRSVIGNRYAVAEDGWYAFDSLANGYYMIKPWYQSDDSVSVDILDAVQAMRFLAGIEIFSPYQMIAADVTGDCRIKIDDVVKILRKIARLERFPHDWAFVDRAFAINIDSWCAAPDSIVAVMAGTGQMNLNFLGIRKGDVSGSWCPQEAGFGNAVFADGAPVKLTFGNASYAEDARVSVPIAITNDNVVAGLELHLKYDPTLLTFAGVSSGVAEGIVANAEGDNIHIAWADIDGAIIASERTAIFTLHFRAVEKKPESMTFTVEKAIAGDRQGRLCPVVVSDGSVSSDNAGAVPKQFALSQNYPNPFNPITRIDFNLPGKTEVQFDVFNIAGQRVRTLINGVIEAGVHSIMWDGRDNAGASVASGIYFYRLKTGQFTATRRMVLVK